MDEKKEKGEKKERKKTNNLLLKSHLYSVFLAIFLPCFPSVLCMKALKSCWLD